MTVDTFEPDLMNLLYPGWQDGNFKPYYVYKWERSNMASLIRHYPPATKSYLNYHAPVEPPSSIGFRGLMVQDYDTPMVNQGYVKLCWVGLDIDAEDNGHVIQHLKLGTLADYVSTLLCNLPAVVRCSKSGQGAHVLVPLAEVELMSYDRARAVTKAIAKRFEGLLLDEDIKTCVTGLPNMWLYTQGGAQKTLGKTNDLYHPTESELSAQVFQTGPVDDKGVVGPALKLDGLAAKMANQLVSDGIIGPELPSKTQVNIGRVKRSLAKIGIGLDTRSKCRVEHEHEPNGYIEITVDGTVRVFSNADNNSVILTLVSA